MDWLRIAYQNLPTSLFVVLVVGLLWLACWGLVVAVREVFYRLGWWAQYRYGRNPYTRVCRRCGQRQDCFHYPGGVNRWEPMGAAIKDGNCACNR